MTALERILSVKLITSLDTSSPAFPRAEVARSLIEHTWARNDVYHMLNWAILFLVIALVAAVLGFGGIAGAAAGIAKILFFVFLVIFVISLLAGMARRGP